MEEQASVSKKPDSLSDQFVTRSQGFQGFLLSSDLEEDRQDHHPRCFGFRVKKVMDLLSLNGTEDSTISSK